MSEDRSAKSEVIWRSMLIDGYIPFQRYRRLFTLLPSEPRCTICNSPFGGAGGKFVRRFMKRYKSNYNPKFCNVCDEVFRANPGGVEGYFTMMFADVRGSTTLAEGMSASEFSTLMGRFYTAATEAVKHTDGLIEKFVGDEVVAVYVPGIAGKDYARCAIHAAQHLLKATGHTDSTGPWLPVGAGVHSGDTFVGVVGSAGVLHFTVLGDPPNATARLASVAKAGEILVSEDTLKFANLAHSHLEKRKLDLKGRSEPLSARVLHADTPL